MWKGQPELQYIFNVFTVNSLYNELMVPSKKKVRYIHYYVFYINYAFYNELLSKFKIFEFVISRVCYKEVRYNQLWLYLKFGNSFRGIDNYDFTSSQPWSLPCPICDGKHENYGLHSEWYKNETEYCLTCFTSSNKFRFAMVA